MAKTDALCTLNSFVVGLGWIYLDDLFNQWFMNLDFGLFVSGVCQSGLVAVRKYLRGFKINFFLEWANIAEFDRISPNRTEREPGLRSFASLASFA